VIKAANITACSQIALKIRAAERKASVRHVIMTALRCDGIAINEIDMLDASLRTRSLKPQGQG
jgi:hypothetical protein